MQRRAAHDIRTGTALGTRSCTCSSGPGAYVRTRFRILVVIGVVAAVAAGFGYLVVDPCSRLFSCRDSADVVSKEQRELMLGAKRLFEHQRVSWLKTSLALPKPLAARVTDGPNATLTVAAPIASNSLEYAAEWYRVYHIYHRGTHTVSLHIDWKSGKLTQVFPVNEI